jgi:hypothetical protein
MVFLRVRVDLEAPEARGASFLLAGRSRYARQDYGWHRYEWPVIWQNFLQRRFWGVDERIRARIG